MAIFTIRECVLHYLHMILAVDIGGTKTLVALCDEERAIIKHVRFETQPDYQKFVTHLLEVIKSEFWNGSIRAIGLAAAGVVDENSGIFSRFGNLPWRNVDIGNTLRHAFRTQVVVDNDANVAGLYAVRQLDPIPQFGLYITIGTGIGTGLIAKGHIDPILAKSEGGHMVFPWKGEHHTWEGIASGRSILRDFQKYAYEIKDPRMWEEIAERISMGLLALIPAVQPDVVIFGGGIGTHFDQYKDSLEQKIKSRLPALIPLPPMSQVPNPEEAVIYGCCELVNQAFPAQ